MKFNRPIGPNIVIYNIHTITSYITKLKRKKQNKKI